MPPSLRNMSVLLAMVARISVSTASRSSGVIDR
jgi:hypothetical protein